MEYIYFCKKCNNEKIIEHSIKEDPSIICEKCNEKMKIKIFGGTGIIFNAKGFYKTDN